MILDFKFQPHKTDTYLPPLIETHSCDRFRSRTREAREVVFSFFNYLKYFVTAAALKEAISLIIFTAETSKG